MKRRNPEEWVCVENCHEPIVSRELFEEAHRKINRRQYARHKKTSEKRKKLCICGCCGHVLEKIHGRYKCPSNLNPEKLNCRKVRMDAELFENTVLDYIRVTSESFLENLSVSQKKIAKGQDDAGEPENIRRQIKNLKTKRFQAYDDYTREKLSREEMQTIRATLLAEINDLKEMLTVREHEIEIAEASSSNVGEEELKTLAELPVFDEAAISELVKKIILYDDGNIEIIWNTDDFLQTV
jgi:hypothetical protein